MRARRARLGLGVDAGGTFTKIFAVTEGGVVLAESRVPTEPASGPAAYVRRVAAAAQGLERGLGARAAAAGLGIAGDVDSERGFIRYSPNLKPFEGYALKRALEAALGRPVAMDNDANMAAWGCYAVELRRAVPNVAAITMGTGIGGGLVLGGKLHRGATGSAGEVGHTRVEPGGELCHCGARGCLEAYAGRYAIERYARRLMRRTRSRLSRAADLDPRAVAEAARAGDDVARRVWRRVGWALGVGIANLVYLVNPDVVLLVGGVSRASELVLAPLREALAREPFRTPFGHCRVRVARRAEIGALGAALYGLDAVR